MLCLEFLHCTFAKHMGPFHSPFSSLTLPTWSHCLCRVFYPPQHLHHDLQDGQRPSETAVVALGRWEMETTWVWWKVGVKELGLLHSVVANLGKPQEEFTVLPGAATVTNSESLRLCLQLCINSANSTQQDVLLLHTCYRHPGGKNIT